MFLLPARFKALPGLLQLADDGGGRLGIQPPFGQGLLDPGWGDPVEHLFRREVVGVGSTCSGFGFGSGGASTFLRQAGQTCPAIGRTRVEQCGQFTRTDMGSPHRTGIDRKEIGLTSQPRPVAVIQDRVDFIGDDNLVFQDRPPSTARGSSSAASYRQVSHRTTPARPPTAGGHRRPPSPRRTVSSTGSPDAVTALRWMELPCSTQARTSSAGWTTRSGRSSAIGFARAG